MFTYDSMLGRRCEHGCRCCWTRAGSGAGRTAARRTAKRRERTTWKQEVATVLT